MITHVFANRSNIGDWLSAQGIQSLLAPLPVRELLCDEPFVPDTLAALAEHGAEDLVVLGGGGLFMDYFAPFWSGFSRLLGRFPFVIWGAGCCDLKAEVTRLDQRVLRQICAAAELCVVRDEATSEQLRGLPLPAAVPCPSLVMLEPPAEPGHGLLHAANLTTVGEPAYHCMRATGLRFAAATGRPYTETNNRIRPNQQADLDAVLQEYAGADLVLSSRLHGCLIGLGLGRPVLGVSGDHKLESFFDSAGLTDWLLEADEATDPVRLERRLEQLADQPPVSDFLTSVRAANRAVADAVRELVPGLEAAWAAN